MTLGQAWILIGVCYVMHLGRFHCYYKMMGNPQRHWTDIEGQP